MSASPLISATYVLMVLLSGSVPNRTPGATANDGVEPGITRPAARYGGPHHLRKKPAPDDAGRRHEVDHLT
jgi:hypothetical protein